MTDQPEDLQRLRQLMEAMKADEPALLSQLQTLELTRHFFKMGEARRLLLLAIARDFAER
jgi:hypothetical protein